MSPDPIRDDAPSRARFVAAALFVGFSTAMTLVLVLQHFGGVGLPGCGEGSGCAKAANSVWGKVTFGGFEWPVSFLGLAYFAGAFVAWLASRGIPARGFRFVVRLGALVSLGFSVILLVERTLCPYCLSAHLGNFAFWATVEKGTGPSPPPRRALTTAAAVFILVTVLLGVVDTRVRSDARQEAERDRSQAAERIIQQSRRGEFTGRYRIGPAEAPIRIVMFTDYQCADCFNIERQLTRLHDTRDDLSISIKHFPFNSDCNDHISRRVHSNACWAARAAEAAGMLWGPEGFWKMHEWLFARRGRFETNQELEDGIRSLGYDPEGFVSVMTSDETLAAVKADTDEGYALGLHFTPMIFINGVELKGWNAPEALIRTVEEVAATNPPSRSAASDRPPLALDKAVDDWRFQPELTLPPDAQPWVTGAGAGARVRVVVWGDYQETGTARADSIIRAFADGRDDVSYAFRHFPFNSDCNPKVEDRRHPMACVAARAAEAAGALGGSDAYWEMHAWLMENPGACDEEGLKGRAAELGLDRDAFWAAMKDPAAQRNILDDVAAGDHLPQLRHGAPKGIFSVPTIFVNERYVPRYWINGQSVLTPILEEAAAP